MTPATRYCNECKADVEKGYPIPGREFLCDEHFERWLRNETRIEKMVANKIRDEDGD
jgi:hypothetical protein